MSFEQIILREGPTIFIAILAFFMGIVITLAFFSAFMVDINTFIDKIDLANKILDKINEKISKYKNMILSESNEAVRFILAIRVDTLSELYEELETLLNPGKKEE